MELSRKKCFVISPIGPESSIIRRHANEVFKYIIKPAMDECNLEPLRSDHLSAPGRITEQVFEHLTQDDICIAVLTGCNPNVFYELAIAHAAQRPVIIMAEKGTDLPFDVSHLRCVFYDLWPSEILNETYIKELVAQVRQIDGANWLASPISDWLSRNSNSWLRDHAPLSPKSYSIIGLQNVDPVANESFQSFRFDRSHNRNPVANLWADPQEGNYIRANFCERDGESVLRVVFESMRGLTPTAAIHPQDLVACSLPRGCTRLAFKAGAASGMDTRKQRQLALGLRLVDGSARHWYYGGKIAAAFEQFRLTPTFEWHYVNLRNHNLWRPFSLAGPPVHDGAQADFSVVCSVVFHFGTFSDRPELDTGKGSVDIGEIRFTGDDAG